MDKGNQPNILVSIFLKSVDVCK